jgi:hypothetical protein
MKHDDTNPKARRDFLKASAALGAGAAATALLPVALDAAAEAPDPAGCAADRPEHKGYEVTPHVVDYYRTARI